MVKTFGYITMIIFLLSIVAVLGLVGLAYLLGVTLAVKEAVAAAVIVLLSLFGCYESYTLFR